MQSKKIKQDLENFITIILNNQPYKPEDHMMMYTNCTTFCQSSYGNALELYQTIDTKCKFKLKQMLMELRKIISINDMLDFVIQSHKTYLECCQKLSRVFGYLDRFFVINQKSVNGGYQEYIHKHCMSLFWDHYLKPDAKKIVDGAMLLLSQEREDINMTQTNRERIKGIMSLFLFFSNSEMVTENVIMNNIYDKYYQEEYKLAAEKYYKNLNEIFNNYDVSKFLEKTIEIIELERERSQWYTASNLQKEIWEFLQQKFICEQCNFIVTKMGSLLKKRELDDLKRCFIVLKDGNKIEDSKKTFEEYAMSIGMQYMEHLHKMEIPVDIIKQVIKYYSEIIGLIRECFQENNTYISAFSNVFRTLINGETLVLNVHIGTIVPEYLAKYIDIITKETTGEELNNQLDIIFNIYEHIENKDIFENYYTKGIAKRMLLRGNTEDLALENNVFGKHKIKFTSSFSYRISKMMSDLSVSQTLSEQFIDKINIPYPFYVNILQTSVWPFEEQSFMFQMPEELTESQMMFERWYIRNHPRRKLQWLHQYTRGKIKTNYLSKTYTFLGNAYQLSILMLFNENDTLTIQQIFERVHLTLDIVRSIVNSLKQMKIVNIDKNENVSINMSFSHAKLKLTLPIPKTIVGKEEKEIVEKEITIERIGIIEACIVKLMKRNKRMIHNELIQNVVTTLSGKFSPSIPLIKKAIESLIEREYIARCETKRDEYIYME